MTSSQRLTVSLLSTFALSIAACGDDSAGSTDSGTASSTVNESATDDAGSASANTGGSGSESAGTTAAEDAWVPATGISITTVELNQGTRLDIAQGRDWLDPPARTSFAVKDRDSIVRVHYTVPDDWAPREIEARLHLHYLDGGSETLSQTLTVTSSSSEASLDSTFYFGLAAADNQASAGTKFQVELYEEPGASQGEPAVWQTPADGPNWIGFEADPMQLKIVLVPVHYQADGEDIVAEVNDDDLSRIEDAFFEANPVQEVLLEVHSPMAFTESLGGDLFTGLSPLLSAVAQLRAQDNPAPNVYYHALLDQGCQFVGCTQGGGLLGQAINIPGPTMGEANLRIASSIYHKPDGAITDMSLETMVHEHGHTQGLQHIYCPTGGSLGNDPTFPDPEGRIGAWGLGMRSLRLHDPVGEYDYMSYCRPMWLGPWTWNKTYERIRALSSWDFGAVDPGATYPVLVGAFHENGSTEWWTMDGAVRSEALSATDHVEFSLAGEWVSQPVEIHELSESDAYWIVTPLPGPVAELEQIRHVQGTRTTAVALDEVKVLHHATAFAHP